MLWSLLHRQVRSRLRSRSSPRLARSPDRKCPRCNRSAGPSRPGDHRRGSQGWRARKDHAKSTSRETRPPRRKSRQGLRASLPRTEIHCCVPLTGIRIWGPTSCPLTILRAVPMMSRADYCVNVRRFEATACAPALEPVATPQTHATTHHNHGKRAAKQSRRTSTSAP